MSPAMAREASSLSPRRARIGLVISSLRAGGSERVASILAGAWIEQGMEVILLTAYPPETDFYPLPETVRRLTWGFVPDTTGRVRRVAGHFGRLLRLRRAIQETTPDVLIAFGDTTNLMTLISRAGMRVPVIVSERTDPRHAPCGWITQRIRPWLYRRAKYVVVQSQAVRAWARQTIPGCEVYVIPNPLLRPIIARRTQAKTRDRRGRLTPEKGFELLIEHSPDAPPTIGNGSLSFSAKGRSCLH